ncbi:hypothetical protein CYY_001939 [Polysphondylium violaceum]|uniref:tRNA(Ile)-lysidine synthetase n=1 Tax=Polysphondylium violaceum TaxID=133409 RepID=A0A8J4Q089_9MYCE|nr:hypothetical protein CYY_001939 [Polysphondylium violaceum]
MLTNRSSTLLYNCSKGIKNSYICITQQQQQQYYSNSTCTTSINESNNKKMVDKIDKVMSSVRKKYQIDNIVELQSKIKQDQSNLVKQQQHPDVVNNSSNNNENINSEFENVLLSINDLSSIKTTTTDKQQQQVIQENLIPNIVFENIEKEFEKVMGSLDIMKNETFIVGSSGGPDSMALCFLLRNYCRKYNLKLIAVTIDHQLAERSEDIDFLKETFKQLGIKSIVKKIDHQDGGPPNTALMKRLRDHRISILVDLAKQYQCQKIFYGSNKSDQIETFIHRIQRNSGLYGLSSMSVVSPVTSKLWKPIDLVRPLLSATKEELLAFCRHHQIPFYVDPCNANKSFRRNQTRSTINSLSATEKRQLIQGLAIGVDIFQSLKNQGQHFINRLCNEVILKSVDKQVPIIRVPFRYIEALPDFLKIKVLYHINCLLAGQFNFFQINAYQQFLSNFSNNPTKPYAFQNIMIYLQDNDLVAQLSLNKPHHCQPITQHKFDFAGYEFKLYNYKSNNYLNYKKRKEESIDANSGSTYDNNNIIEPTRRGSSAEENNDKYFNLDDLKIRLFIEKDNMFVSKSSLSYLNLPRHGKSVLPVIENIHTGETLCIPLGKIATKQFDNSFYIEVKRKDISLDNIKTDWE